MGNKPYIWMLAAVLVFAVILPQKGPKRKYYIFVMTVLHTCLCGFRYMFITGDLHKYYYSFLECGEAGWFSSVIWEGLRNSGFLLFNKIVYILSEGDFQVLLFLIALIIHVILGYVIYRYSTAPWMSYLIWNCMTFYLFGFNAIRQALAMSLVMLAFIGVSERKPGWFVITMTLACLCHRPALVFIPSYWLATRSINARMVLFYVLLGAAIYVFRNQFVTFIKDFYYDEETTWNVSSNVGSRMIMITGFTVMSILLTGLYDHDYRALFHLMAISSILQMLSSFDNVFTRLTDYCFQFLVLYLPMVFFKGGNKPLRIMLQPLLPFNARSRKVFAGLVCMFLLWYYFALCLNQPIGYEVDNVINYRSMWDVK